VFHGSDKWSVYEGPKYVYAPQLLEMLTPYRDRVEIVLSSWGSSWPDEALMAALPQELGEMIKGSLWLAGHESDYRSDLATRFACIQLWLKHQRPEYVGDWISISTDSSGWPEAKRDRFIHGAGLLSSEVRTQELAERLREMLS
jgi:hypothetical protein